MSERGLLIDVSPVSHLRDMDIVRAFDGKPFYAIPRVSGKVRLYPFRMARTGCPFSRPVPDWITDRKEELVESIFGCES